jgi:hypothetical protein
MLSTHPRERGRERKRGNQSRRKRLFGVHSCIWTETKTYMKYQGFSWTKEMSWKHKMYYNKKRKERGREKDTTYMHIHIYIIISLLECSLSKS